MLTINVNRTKKNSLLSDLLDAIDSAENLIPRLEKLPAQMTNINSSVFFK
jgi:hypothetical protein